MHALGLRLLLLLISSESCCKRDSRSSNSTVAAVAAVVAAVAAVAIVMAVKEAALKVHIRGLAHLSTARKYTHVAYSHIEV
jgi:hypothetical protein